MKENRNDLKNELKSEEKNLNAPRRPNAERGGEPGKGSAPAKNRDGRDNRENRDNRDNRGRDNRNGRNHEGRDGRDNREQREQVRDKSAGKNAKGKNKTNQNGQSGQNGNKNADNRKDTYVYVLDGNIYINLTNKCSNGCLFCVRNERASYYGNFLWLRHGDPTPEKVIAAMNALGDLSKYREVVFCGFGEPTYKMSEMAAVADYAHAKGLGTRLNTNGQGDLINKREIVPELKGKIDKINISLNASSAEKYQPVCRSQFKEAGYTAILDFARQCRRAGIECWFSVVDIVGEEEVAACRRVADSVGIPLRVRKYIADS